MPAARVAVEALGLQPGDRLLDVACGTGNAALLAAEKGASVLGVDGAPRLIDVARRRAGADGLDATFEVGDAAALPVPDDGFDAAVSVFGVIFADVREGAAELLRAVRPGGRIAFTTWTAKGATPKVMNAVREALGGPEVPPTWSDPEVVRSVFAPHAVTFTEHPLSFPAPSLEAFIEEQFEHQPMWMTAADALREAGKLDAVMVRVREILAAANEDPDDGFRTTSTYHVATVAVGEHRP